MQGFNPAFSLSQYFMKYKMKKIKKYQMLILCMLMLCTIILSPLQANAAFNKTTAKKNVTVTYKQLPNGVLAIYKNKNKTALKLTATMSFCDGDNKSISKEKLSNLCLGGKSTAALFFQAPHDEYGNIVNYSSYVGSFSVAKSKYTSHSEKISVSSELDVIEGRFSATNLSGKELANIHATIVFYDSNNGILGCFTKYLNCFGKGAVDQFSIGYVNEMPQPSKAKVYIDWAY